MHMSRTHAGVQVNTDACFNFEFDGKTLQGCEGDTIASALLANGVVVIGRGFKYHRPRGVWGSWTEEPNAIVQVTLNKRTLPNCLATTTLLETGMQVKSVNAFPSAAFDIKGGLNLLRRWLGAGFYYKTFMWPNWHLFEPMIRKMAGLGAVSEQCFDDYVSDQLHETCDVLVVGAGPAGLVAARTAAEAGESVWLVDDHHTLGATHFYHEFIEGVAARSWIATQLTAIIAAGATVYSSTTAFGIYDHQLVGLMQLQGFAQAPRLIRLRASRIILATGAIDRPLLFRNNDLPGIFSQSAALDYLSNYGVSVGKRVGLASVHNADQVHDVFAKHAIEVVALNPQDEALSAIGRKQIQSVNTSTARESVDALVVCGGLTPTIHLWSHQQGGLRWQKNIHAFVPNREQAPAGLFVVGAAAGIYTLEDALSDAVHVAIGRASTPNLAAVSIPMPSAKTQNRDSQWIDVQHDVTVKDVDVAVQENYASVEHVKRYTTLGMAVDQGKTSNMLGLAALADKQKVSIPEVGITTFRPPFVPVPLVTYGGQHTHLHSKPPKRLVLEPTHRALNAALCEYGGWLRPGWYGDGRMDEHVQQEVLMTREQAGILDASALGKIEVMGPDARNFLNFVYYNRLDNLQPGHIRYGFMLTEGGSVYDDGVVWCMDEHRFLVSCSSSHVAGVEQLLESWRQDGNNPNQIYVHNATSQWATITVTGPKALDIVNALPLPIELNMAEFKHMRFLEATYQNHTLRIARVSFSGEISFELSVPTTQALMLWNDLLRIGKPLQAGPLGLEAMSVMRAEKGYIIVGKDTDGETMPHDLGFTGPRANKTAAFVGDRSLHTKTAQSSSRRQWVGFTVPKDQPMIPVGAHLVNGGDKPKSIGVVTSSYFSPTLQQPIALGLLEAGALRLGEQVSVWHMGQQSRAKVVSPCFYDVSGARLHAG